MLRMKVVVVVALASTVMNLVSAVLTLCFAIVGEKNHIGVMDELNFHHDVLRPLRYFVEKFEASVFHFLIVEEMSYNSKVDLELTFPPDFLVTFEECRG